MKILYLRYYSNNNMTHWQDMNFIHELSQYDVDFEVLNFTNQTQEEIIAQIKLKYDDVDLFLSSCDDEVLSKELMQVIDEKSIPTLLMCFDNLSVPFKHKNCCRFFDLVWITSKETEYLFKKWGAKIIFLPYAANPFVYKPIKGINNKIPGVTFIGSCYGIRRRKIEEILREGHIVNLFGGNSISNEQPNPLLNSLINIPRSLKSAYNLSRFEIGRKCLISAMIKSISSNGHVSDEFKLLDENRIRLTFDEMVEYYSRSQLSLGISELWNTYKLNTPIHKIHLRTFEIPMSGGALITSRTDEMLDYFEDKKEILLYENIEEMNDIMSFYLNDKNEKLLTEIKYQARNRSLKEHTWRNRFGACLKELGGSNESFNCLL